MVDIIKNSFMRKVAPKITQCKRIVRIITVLKIHTEVRITNTELRWGERNMASNGSIMISYLKGKSQESSAQQQEQIVVF